MIRINFQSKLQLRRFFKVKIVSFPVYQRFFLRMAFDRLRSAFDRCDCFCAVLVIVMPFGAEASFDARCVVRKHLDHHRVRGRYRSTVIVHHRKLVSAWADDEVV